MPGFYTIGEYDIAGFAVGVVEEDEIVNGSDITEEDVIIAISSSGAHSNWFSLIRKLFTDLNEKYEGKTIGEYLLTPTKIYVKSIQKLMKNIKIIFFIKEKFLKFSISFFLYPKYSKCPKFITYYK